VLIAQLMLDRPDYISPEEFAEMERRVSDALSDGDLDFIDVNSPRSVYRDHFRKKKES
jgi:hypothetical protein